MKTLPPELGFKRLLSALEQDLLDATDEEILAIANELGMKPGMKGSIALFGVTFAARLKDHASRSEQQIGRTHGRGRGAANGRRRPKGSAPSSS